MSKRVPGLHRGGPWPLLLRGAAYNEPAGQSPVARAAAASVHVNTVLDTPFAAHDGVWSVRPAVLLPGDADLRANAFVG